MERKTRVIFDRVSRSIRGLLKGAEANGDKLVFVPIIVYFVFFSAYTCYMHYTFKTFAWDLGIITQSLWTTLNSGKTLFSTLEVPYGNPSGNFLGVHFSPILFVILPVYALYQSPETLLVFQSFILAVAALPLYWLARDKLNSKIYGLAFAVAYLLNPALHGVNTFDFHLEIFTPAFILFSFYYLEKGKWIKAAPFIVLELMTLEFAPFIVFPLGLYFFVRRTMETRRAKKDKITLAKRMVGPTTIMIVSVLCLFLSLYTIETINPLKAGGAPGRWEHWGANFSEIISNIVRNPFEAITIMATPIEKSYFTIFLFASTLFLPLLAPIELLMSIPWLLAALLTDYQPYYQPFYQYSAFMLGQMFIATIYGFRKLFPSIQKLARKADAEKKIIAVLLAVNTLLFLAISPVAISAFTKRNIRPYAISNASDLNHVSELHKVLSFIAPNASIATVHDIFPHVCQRLHAYFLNWPLDYDVDYVLVDAKSPTFTWGIYGPTPDEITTKLLKSGEYGLLASSDGIMLLQKGYNGSIQYFSPFKDIYNYNQLIPLMGRIRWDYSSMSGKIITSDPNSSNALIWFGPYAYLNPGDFTVSFRISTTNETCQAILEAVTEEGNYSLARRVVNGTEFERLGTWQSFEMHFRIDLPTKLEFRGRCISNETMLSMDYVSVNQIQP